MSSANCNLQDAQAQPVARVAARFADVWTRLRRLADAADLPARAREHLAKAEWLTTQLLTTLAFFFVTLQAKVEALNLPPDLEEAVLAQLIPAICPWSASPRAARTPSRAIGCGP